MIDNGEGMVKIVQEPRMQRPDSIHAYHRYPSSEDSGREAAVARIEAAMAHLKSQVSEELFKRVVSHIMKPEGDAARTQMIEELKRGMGIENFKKFAADTEVILPYEGGMPRSETAFEPPESPKSMMLQVLQKHYATSGRFKLDERFFLEKIVKMQKLARWDEGVVSSSLRNLEKAVSLESLKSKMSALTEKQRARIVELDLHVDKDSELYGYIDWIKVLDTESLLSERERVVADDEKITEIDDQLEFRRLRSAKEESSESLVSQELKGSREFALKILKFYELMWSIVMEPEDKAPTPDQFKEIQSTIIELWNEVGFNDVSPLIETALEPLLNDPENPMRYHIALSRYNVVREQVPYRTVSGDEFLDLTKDDLELRKLMLADITSFLADEFLDHFDRRITPKEPEPKSSYTRRGKDSYRDKTDYDSPKFASIDGSGSMYSREREELVKPAPSKKDKEQVIQMIEERNFPDYFLNMSHELYTAYKARLVGYSVGSIGDSVIRQNMERGDSFSETIDQLTNKAELVVLAKQNLEKIQLAEQKMRDDLITYKRLIKASGPHSTLGKFYRKQITRIDNLLGEKTSF